MLEWTHLVLQYSEADLEKWIKKYIFYRNVIYKSNKYRLIDSKSFQICLLIIKVYIISIAQSLYEIYIKNDANFILDSYKTGEKHCLNIKNMNCRLDFLNLEMLELEGVFMYLKHSTTTLHFLNSLV